MRIVLGMAMTVLAASIGAAATAQTTNCLWFGNQLHCQTTQPIAPAPPIVYRPPPPPDFSGLIGAIAARRQAQQQAAAQARAIEDAQAQATEAAAQPAHYQHWSKGGATQEVFMKDRYECLREAIAPNGEVVADVAFACLEARGYRKDDNGDLGPPDDPQ